MLWIDMETTGLEAAWDVPLEVTLGITNPNLDLMYSKTWLIDPESCSANRWADFLANPVDEFVRTMHTKNGLIADLQDGASAKPIRTIESQMVEFLKDHHHVDPKPVLCGSSLRLDRNFLDAWIPVFADHLHYRSIDVSTIKELVGTWYPRLAAARPRTPDEDKAHRTLDDMQASITELAWYRQHVFVPMDWEPRVPKEEEADASS